MVNSCSALGCTTRFKKQAKIKFHRFPKDATLRKKWMVAVGRKNFVPSATASICSKHFKDSDYVETVMDTLRLREGAVPSIFGFSQHPTKEKKSRRPLIRQTDPCTENLIEVSSTSYNEDPPTLTEPAKVEDVPVTRINIKRNKRDPIYFGDFEEHDLDCPVKRKRYWEVSHNILKKKNAALKILRQQNQRLTNKLKNLDAVINDLKSKKELSWYYYSVKN